MIDIRNFRRCTRCDVEQFPVHMDNKGVCRRCRDYLANEEANPDWDAPRATPDDEEDGCELCGKVEEDLTDCSNCRELLCSTCYDEEHQGPMAQCTPINGIYP